MALATHSSCICVVLGSAQPLQRCVCPLGHLLFPAQRTSVQHPFPMASDDTRLQELPIQCRLIVTLFIPMPPQFIQAHPLRTTGWTSYQKVSAILESISIYHHFLRIKFFSYFGILNSLNTKTTNSMHPLRLPSKRLGMFAETTTDTLLVLHARHSGQGRNSTWMERKLWWQPQTTTGMGNAVAETADTAWQRPRVWYRCHSVYRIPRWYRCSLRLIPFAPEFRQVLILRKWNVLKLSNRD